MTDQPVFRRLFDLNDTYVRKCKGTVATLHYRNHRRQCQHIISHIADLEFIFHLLDPLQIRTDFFHM